MKSKIESLWLKVKQLDKRRNKYMDEIKKLELEQTRQKYTCQCVALNKNLGIFNMTEQEIANRKGLQFGLVGETLSAWRGCLICKGTGK